MEYNFPSDGIGDFTEVYFIRVCIGNLVAMGIFLQYNDSVFVKIGAEAGFVTEKIFAGNTVYGLIPVFQFDILIAIAFQSLDGITFTGIVCLCLDIHHSGTAVVQISGFFPPAFFLCQCDRLNPGEVVAPAACQPVYVMPFVADNLCPLGFFFIVRFPVKGHSSSPLTLFICG